MINKIMFVKFIDEYTIITSIPKFAIVDGKPTANPKPEKLGYKVLYEKEDIVLNPEKSYRPYYEEYEDHILKSWEEYEKEEYIEEEEEEPEIIKTYSKYKIVKALIGLNQLSNFYNALSFEEQKLWDSAINLKSNDEFFIEIKSSLPQLLDISLEFIEEILENCKS